MTGREGGASGDPGKSTDLSTIMPFLVYHWFHGQFPDWKPDWDPKYELLSQSLKGARIPGSVPGPHGMVHFKNPSDPLWSREELAAVRSAYGWILVVLSPLEEFRSLDTAISEMSAQSSRLVVWRPDQPTDQELSHLKSIDCINSLRKAASSPAADHGAEHNEAQEILTALYQERGMLLVQGMRHMVAKELGEFGLQRYVSACLLSLAAGAPTLAGTSNGEAEHLAWRWSALLCGPADQLEGDGAAENLTLEWVARHLDTEPGMLRERLQPLPDSFQTNRFIDEVKTYDEALERVAHLFGCLRRREITFVQAMTQISRVFNGDEDRLLRWKGVAEEIHGFNYWLPAFESAFAYVSGSFPTPIDRLEKTKASLLEAAADPHRFLNARERQCFVSEFEEYKRGYVEYYGAVHEDTVHIVGNQEKMKTRLDSVSLRNLELLSDLPGAKMSYLNHARALGKLVQAHQCDLPVYEILARRPRCYCNFNPDGNSLLVQSVDRMNETVRQGIDHFRSMLRGCRMLIIRELQLLGIDDAHSKQIAALLSQGPMVPLKQQSIDILAAVMKRHPDAFRTPEYWPKALDF